ncbi:MAG: serine protease, partial [Bryobacteraceae bacterium]|nr:serine protease [Bryobacteraceae bacterium]
MPQPQPYLVKVAGTVQGTAIFIAPTLLLTCRHVVRIRNRYGVENTKWTWGTRTGWGPSGDDSQTGVTIYDSDRQEPLGSEDLAVLEVATPIQPSCIPAWKDPEPHLRLKDEVRALGYPRGIFEEEPRTLIKIGSSMIQVQGTFQPGASGGVLEFSDHRRAYCFALIQAEQKVLGHCIPFSRISQFLAQLNLKLPEQAPSFVAAHRSRDIGGYRARLSQNLGKINLGGLLINSSVQKVDIEKLWVAPRTTQVQEPDRQHGFQGSNQSAVCPDRHLLTDLINRNRVFAVIGEAGSGKSTLLQRLGYALARPDRYRETISLDCTGLPLWVPLRDLESFLTARMANRMNVHSPEHRCDIRWIAEYLAHGDEAQLCGLDREFFEEQLRRQETSAMLFLDGFDEVSSAARHDFRALIERAAEQFRCRILISSRPEAAHQRPDGETGCLFGGVPQASIPPLNPE